MAVRAVLTNPVNPSSHRLFTTRLEPGRQGFLLSQGRRPEAWPRKEIRLVFAKDLGVNLTANDQPITPLPLGSAQV